ncbi:hypothetical protein, partial [Saccharomonospora iraqiensis]|uniref:hypothetical protein n=1 Tax=Saccharomonospora iraqiensis TaxID=52698 RepID=UPI001F3B1DCF
MASGTEVAHHPGHDLVRARRVRALRVLVAPQRRELGEGGAQASRPPGLSGGLGRTQSLGGHGDGLGVRTRVPVRGGENRGR